MKFPRPRCHFRGVGEKTWDMSKESLGTIDHAKVSIYGFDSKILFLKKYMEAQFLHHLRLSRSASTQPIFPIMARPLLKISEISRRFFFDLFLDKVYACPFSGEYLYKTILHFNQISCLTIELRANILSSGLKFGQKLKINQ